jgi:hypothetical protein
MIWIKCGKENVRNNLYSDCEFYGNRCSEGHALPTAINEFLSMYSTFIVI